MAMFIASDDDSDEDLQFDASPVPRYVVPSYCQQLYSSHSLAPGAENDDDGWNSDDEVCLPDLPEQGGMGKKNIQYVYNLYTMVFVYNGCHNFIIVNKVPY